jgi:hypothetical protein
MAKINLEATGIVFAVVLGVVGGLGGAYIAGRWVFRSKCFEIYFHEKREAYHSFIKIASMITGLHPEIEPKSEEIMAAAQYAALFSRDDTTIELEKFCFILRAWANANFDGMTPSVDDSPYSALPKIVRHMKREVYLAKKDHKRYKAQKCEPISYTRDIKRDITHGAKKP